jgi:hypothetical protein
MTTLFAEDYGIVGDGATDNTPGLIALRDQIRAGADRVWTVDFDPGHYVYSDNRWTTFGDRAVILEFNHSTVECSADSFLTLGAGPIAWDAEYPIKKSMANLTLPPGYVIATTDVGAREARLLSPLAGQFAPGDRVLVAGDIQQLTEDGTAGWGWPPNFRAFEWKTVAAVVDEFTLGFVDPFRFAYDAGWPDYIHSFGGLPYGTPRIWRGRLDDGRHINRSLTIRNANFVGGRNRAPGTRTPLSGRGWHIRFEHCTTAEDTDCWPSECYRNEYLDCRLARMEMDKIVERFRMEGGEVYGGLSSGGAAVLDVSFRDVSFYGFARVTPRRSWMFEGACHFYDGVMLSKGLTNTPFGLTSAASEV